MTMKLRSRLTGFRASFRFRLFIIFTLLTALITLLFSFMYIVKEVRNQRRLAADKARMLATHLAESVRLPLYAENREALLLLAEDTARYPEIHAVVIRTNEGRVLADFHRPTAPPLGDLLSETVEVRSNPLGAAPETAFTGGNASGAQVGWVRLDLDTSGLKQTIRQTIVSSCLLALGFWLTGSLLSYLALRQVTRSFNALMKGLETMRTGNFAVKIRVERDDEPGRAAAAINELASALQQREQENKRLQEELIDAMRLEVKEEKRLLMAKLIQTNRMTSLGLLASSMAHEINNPNATIRLAGQYLDRAWRDALPLLQQVSKEEGDFSLGGVPFSAASNNIVDCCATIDRNSERIAHVIQDLRSYSLGERNAFRHDVNINHVVGSALTIIRSHGKHNDTAIVAETAADIPVITGSHHQLEQVVVNLLLNAVQALPEGKGKVTVETSLNPASQEVHVTVRDEGEGIPPELRERLLEPFFSTRIDKGGSGLGLFVASFIVNEHNGSLEFSSTPGAGTTVTVRLPLRPPLPRA